MGANYLDSIKEIKKGGNYLPPFLFMAEFILLQLPDYRHCCR